MIMFLLNDLSLVKTQGVAKICSFLPVLGKICSCLSIIQKVFYCWPDKPVSDC